VPPRGAVDLVRGAPICGISLCGRAHEGAHRGHRRWFDRTVGGGAPSYRWGGSPDDAPGTEASAERLAAEFAATFPTAANLRIDRSWSGVIDYVLDTLPLIGRLRDHPAIVYVGGWCGHGIALSMSSGAWVTHLINHQRPPENLPWFRDRAPWLPLEPVRWLGVPISGWAMSMLDRL
jgi:glycine/D-amino acid oxidase-like deaminating enzyme